MMTELVERAKLTCLITEKTISLFIGAWKSLMDFLPKEKEKKTLMIQAFIISQDRLQTEES